MSLKLCVYIPKPKITTKNKVTTLLMRQLLSASLLAILTFVSLSVSAQIRWLPVIASSPETGFQYGALLLQSLDEEAVDGKLSSIQYVAINSTEDQQRLVIRPTLYYFDYKLKLTPVINYSSFPEKFYGIGNDTDEDNEEDFTSDYLFLKMAAQYNFYSNFHLQYIHSIDDREITDLEKDGQIDGFLTTNVQEQEYKLKSNGLGLIWDTRDIPRYPNKGYYAEISQEQFKGGIYEYDENTIDLRAFFPIGKNQVLAAQALQIEQDGDNIPFINLSTIGGSDVVRGVFEGRYRAPDMQALQVEYRKQGYSFIKWDAGFTIFAAAGKVDSDNAPASDNDGFHSAIGVGGHFFFNPEDKTTIRADIAVGDGETGFYLMIDQAF
jgi:hypothetical protein